MKQIKTKSGEVLFIWKWIYTSDAEEIVWTEDKKYTIGVDCEWHDEDREIIILAQ